MYVCVLVDETVLVFVLNKVVTWSVNVIKLCSVCLRAFLSLGGVTFRTPENSYATCNCFINLAFFVSLCTIELATV